jgi:hypothetical protein
MQYRHSKAPVPAKNRYFTDPRQKQLEYEHIPMLCKVNIIFS